MELASQIQMDQLRIESNRLRSLLIKDILDIEHPNSEIGLIEGRLKSIEDRRLALMLDTVRRAKEVVGNIDIRHRNDLFLQILNSTATKDIQE
jgi:hypothetical protein